MLGAIARVSFLTALILLGVACSATYRAYSGPKQPSDEIASIVAGDSQPGARPDWAFARWWWGAMRIEIYKVNNKILPEMKRRQVDLMPGPHCVGIAYYGSIGGPTPQHHRELCLDVEPGHIYQVRHGYELETDKGYAWIVDTTDGSIVAGELPPGESNQGIDNQGR